MTYVAGGKLAIDAGGKQLLDTEEGERLAVLRARHRIVLLVLLDVRRARLLQHGIDDQMVPGGRQTAQRAAEVLWVAVPVVLQAGLAEAVPAEQHHGLPQDLGAHGAGQVLLELGESGGHLPCVVGSCVSEPPARSGEVASIAPPFFYSPHTPPLTLFLRTLLLPSTFLVSTLFPGLDWSSGTSGIFPMGRQSLWANALFCFDGPIM